MSDRLWPATRFAQDLLESVRSRGSSDPQAEALAELDELELRDAGQTHPSGVTAEEYYADVRHALGKQTQTAKWSGLLD